MKHRTNKYLNNIVEQDHGPMKGFNSLKSTERFCRIFDELINFYKVTRDKKLKEQIQNTDKII